MKERLLVGYRIWDEVVAGENDGNHWLIMIMVGGDHEECQNVIFGDVVFGGHG